MSIRVRTAHAQPYHAAHLHLVRGGSGDSLRGVDLDETQPMLRMRAATGEASEMRCLHCDGRVVQDTAPVQVERHGMSLRWEALPAWVCTRCESAYFEEGQVRQVRQALAALRKPVDC